MKTTIYIDGFNLYYGVLRGTPYKWLDLVSLFSSLCKEQNPNCQVVQVKFFTAPVKATLSTRKQQAEHSQRIYIKALQNKYPDIFECIEGFHQITKGLLPKYQKPIDKTEKVPVWRLEEKQTDVNIAINMYRDVARKTTEQVILVSGDSDLVPALNYIKEDHPDIKVGIIFSNSHKNNTEDRARNRELKDASDWNRSSIKDEELKAHELPQKVPTNKKPLVKPNYW